LIYRLISHGTMEEKIYRRQLMKNGLSLRLIDHHEVDRHFTMDSVAKLWTLEEGDEGQ
jgi:transcriptional regulator ATRX